MIKNTLFAALAFIASIIIASAEDAPKLPNPLETPSPKGARVYIMGLKDGKTVKAPVTIRFGLKGMGVCPAGMYLPDTGHHHLLVNMDVSELDPKMPIPSIDGKCLHYGKGQTQVTLDLPKGKHTLQLAFANFAHILHKPAVTSKKITITVE
jgi:hypothetical protein